MVGVVGPLRDCIVATMGNVTDVVRGGDFFICCSSVSGMGGIAGEALLVLVEAEVFNIGMDCCTDPEGDSYFAFSIVKFLSKSPVKTGGNFSE